MTQSCVAVQGDSKEWFLVNASPDLPEQLRRYPDLQPDSSLVRGTPISAVLLTNADLDHVLGLLTLREGGSLEVHASEAARQTLDGSLNLSGVMNGFCGVNWHLPPEGDFVPLIGSAGKSSSLSYRAIALPGGPPLYAKGQKTEGVHSLAYCFLDRNTGGRLLVAPDVAGCPPALKAVMEESDAVLFDGTFWSGDELRQITGKARTAEEMGHLTIQDHSLAMLRNLRARHRIYLHINNTNSILNPTSPERAAVEATGVAVGQDGMEFEL